MRSIFTSRVYHQRADPKAKINPKLTTTRQKTTGDYFHLHSYGSVMSSGGESVCAVKAAPLICGNKMLPFGFGRPADSHRRGRNTGGERTPPKLEKSRSRSEAGGGIRWPTFFFFFFFCTQTESKTTAASGSEGSRWKSPFSSPALVLDRSRAASSLW